MVYVHLLIFAVGLALLVKGSDFFVESASRIAKRFGVSEFVIGLTLVAVGTSIPELASSVVASIEGYPELIIGNIVGSNIANIGLIVGISAAFFSIKTNKGMLLRDGYMMVFTAGLFYLFAFNGVLSSFESLLFLVIYGAYIFFLVKTKDERKTTRFSEFVDYFLRIGYLATLRDVIFGRIRKKEQANVVVSAGIGKDIVVIAFSLVAILYGADFVVDEAVQLAGFFGVSDNIIGLTLVAIGTSLPELGVSLSAVRKGFGDILIGNILGSNIVNILLILGISSQISPLRIPSITLLFTAPFMIFISLLLLFFIWSNGKLKMHEGWIFLLLYVLFMGFVFSGFYM